MAARGKVSRRLKNKQNILMFIGTIRSTFQAALFPEAQHIYLPTIWQKKPLSWTLLHQIKDIHPRVKGQRWCSPSQAGSKECPTLREISAGTWEATVRNFCLPSVPFYNVSILWVRLLMPSLSENKHFGFLPSRSLFSTKRIGKINIDLWIK